MNENDLRDCFAMFALAGSMLGGKSRTAEQIWEIADMMVALRPQKEPEEEGIVAIKKTRKAKE